MGLTPPPPFPVRIRYATVCKAQLIQRCTDQMDTDGMIMNDFQITFQGFAVKSIFHISQR